MGEIQHIITAAPFTPVNLEPIFIRAQELRVEDLDRFQRRENALKYIGGRAVNLFYGESTRTRISFEMAEVALGLGYSSTSSARQFSSAAKGETLAHTVEVVERYDPDFVVLRYDEEGGAKEAADLLKIPLINAGDGKGEHPTQAILDSFTIWEEFDSLDDLNITFMGDLANGRTVRSLLHVLSKGINNSFNFVSHGNFRLSEDIKKTLDAAGVDYCEYFDTSVIPDIFPKTDVLYVTRTQLNLGAQKLTYNDFRVTKDRADLLPEHGIILHPMPINREDLSNTEIDPEIDRHPRSRYYNQAGNGLPTRMTLIERIMEGKSLLG